MTRHADPGDIRPRWPWPRATGCGWWEPLPWILAIAFYFAFPHYLGFGTELLVTILFALSLDLALGYAGIVTLGHAAFFGAGAYTVGMLANHGIWTEPITGLLLAAAVARRSSASLSGLVLLRTTGLTLLMLTLCTMALLEEAANMAAESPAASTASTACRSSRFSACSSSIRSTRTRNISMSSPSCSSASSSCARWSIRRSARA